MNSHYIVTVFNETHNTMISINTTNNITSLTIYGLVKGNNYSFTVKDIDYVAQLWKKQSVSVSHI